MQQHAALDLPPPAHGTNGQAHSSIPREPAVLSLSSGSSSSSSNPRHSPTTPAHPGPGHSPSATEGATDDAAGQDVPTSNMQPLSGTLGSSGDGTSSDKDSVSGSSGSDSDGTVPSSAAAAPPRPVNWHFNAAKHAASQLTRRITCCRTWQELDALYWEAGPTMDFIHLSAMLSHLARLVAGPPRDSSTSSSGGPAQASQEASAGALPGVAAAGAVAGAQHVGTCSEATPSGGRLEAQGRRASAPSGAPLLPAAADFACAASPPAMGAATPTQAPTAHEAPPRSPPPGPAPLPFSAGPAPVAGAAFVPPPQPPPQQQLRAHAPPVELPEALRPAALVAHVQQRLLAQRAALRPREAANCVWALARLQRHLHESAAPGEREPVAMVACALLARWLLWLWVWVWVWGCVCWAGRGLVMPCGLRLPRRPCAHVWLCFVPKGRACFGCPALASSRGAHRWQWRELRSDLACSETPHG